jgi:uncharacterized membrane protein YagU involved in acid resistance
MTMTNRLLLGALAGIAGTFAMTAAARAMQRRLPPSERHPLPPREIVEGALPAPAKRTLDEERRQSATLAAHFGYGAATGALYALLRPKGSLLPGVAYGLLVWTVSYFGIMPGLRILRPASDHPLRRNWLMIVAHLVWGSTLASTLRELELAEGQVSRVTLRRIGTLIRCRRASGPRRESGNGALHLGLGGITE